MRATLILSALAVTVFAFAVVCRSTPDARPVAAEPLARTAEQLSPEPVPFERPTIQAEFGPEDGGGLASAELLQLSNEDLMLKVTQRLLDKRAQLGLERLNPTEQTILRAEALGIKLKREGFAAYYLSPWGDDFRATTRALGEVKSRAMLELLQRSLVVFGGDLPPPDLAERQMRILEASGEDGMNPFLELDQAAQMVLPEHADLVARYTRANLQKLQLE